MWPVVIGAAISAASALSGAASQRKAAGAQSALMRAQQVTQMGIRSGVQTQLQPYTMVGSSAAALYDALLFGVSPLSEEEQTRFTELQGREQELFAQASQYETLAAGQKKAHKAAQYMQQAQQARSALAELDKLRGRHKVAQLGTTSEEIVQGTPGFRAAQEATTRSVMGSRSGQSLLSGNTLRALQEESTKFTMGAYQMLLGAASGGMAQGQQAIGTTAGVSFGAPSAGQPQYNPYGGLGQVGSMMFGYGLQSLKTTPPETPTTG